MKLYQFKIQLLHISPPIWRSFVVPSTLSLDSFHQVIQAVMGWENCHLYEFFIDSKTYVCDIEECPGALDCRKYKLEDVVKDKGAKIKYDYDFGDNWEHELTLIDTDYVSGPLGNHRCLDGKRACPPEDVGGPRGYEELCKAMKKPHSKKYVEYVGWLGKEFDSEYFNIDEANELLT